MPRFQRASRAAIVLCIAALTVAGVAAVRNRAKVTRHVDRFGGADFRLAVSVADGMVSVTGRATLPASPVANRHWWAVVFSARDADGNLVKVSQKQYHDVGFDLPAGQTATPQFFDQFPAPDPGRYCILLGLRESTISAGQDGLPLDPQPYYRAASRWITVP